MERGVPLAGRAGRVFDACLSAAGLQRKDIRIVHRVPCQAPDNFFNKHDKRDIEWGDALLREELDRAIASGVRLIMPLGEAALTAVAPSLPKLPSWNGDEKGEGKGGKIGAWRGSLFPLGEPMNTIESYERALRRDFPSAVPGVLPTFHPAAVAKQFSWHPWAVIDFKRAKRFLDGQWPWAQQRTWHVNDYAALDHLVEVAEAEGYVSVDTEMSPYAIICFVTKHEVHTFQWNERARPAVQRLLLSPRVTKIAHNLGHDFTYLREALALECVPPLLDSGGVAHILDSSLARNLSPALATRFTVYPQHKWMVIEDPKIYCGYDTIVAYDGAFVALAEAKEKGFLPVVERDHKLLWEALRMQWRGVAIDDVARVGVVEELKTDYSAATATWASASEPVVRAKLAKFEKPHLFFERNQCPCCNGGKISAQHCWRCGGLSKKPEKKEDYFDVRRDQAGTDESRTAAGGLGREGVPAGTDAAVAGGPAGRGKSPTVAALRDGLPVCRTCGGTTKVDNWLPLSADSTDQKLDILYRGFGIPARTYKGSDTTRIDQLEPLAGDWPIVRILVDMQKIGTDLETFTRLAPDFDGNQHSVFDPWGTASGRVASGGGLVQKGTNLQNIPKKKRYVIVAEKGHLFIAPDKAQVETRAAAIASGDEALQRIFREPLNWPGHPKHGKIDSHSFVQKLFHDAGVELSRDQCKRIVYAAIFGGSAEQIAVESNAEAYRKGEGGQVTLAQMTRVLATFFGIFAKIRPWQEKNCRSVLTTRTLRTMTGRQRVWPGYVTKTVRYTTATNIVERQFEKFDKVKKRMETYYVILDPDVQKEVQSDEVQDMGAVVLAEGLFNIRREADIRLLDPRIHVHDELVIQIPATPGRLVDEACETAKRLMDVTLWGMSFPTDVGDPAPNWQCAKEAHVFIENNCKHCGKKNVS